MSDHQQGKEHEAAPRTARAGALQAQQLTAADTALALSVGARHGLRERRVAAAGPGHEATSLTAAVARRASMAAWTMAAGRLTVDAGAIGAHRGRRRRATCPAACRRRRCGSPHPGWCVARPATRPCSPLSGPTAAAHVAGPVCLGTFGAIERERQSDDQLDRIVLTGKPGERRRRRSRRRGVRGSREVVPDPVRGSPSATPMRRSPRSMPSSRLTR